MGISNSGLATTLRGERDVTNNLELKMVKLVMDDIPRILADLHVARDCATEAMRDIVGPTAWKGFENGEELEIELESDDDSFAPKP